MIGPRPLHELAQRLVPQLATVEREVRELRRRVVRYRRGRPVVDVRGRTAIVVDDGLATGLADLAAVRALRARGAARIVVAVPVGARESVALVGDEADEIVCHTIPDGLLGVGRWYRDFSPVSDAEVVALLDAASAAAPPLVPAPERARNAVPMASRTLHVDVAGGALAGDLWLPVDPRGLLIFAHGSGSSRLSPRNRAVASALNEAGFATLLFDLLTGREGRLRELVFDIALLARRLELVTHAALDEPATRELPIATSARRPGRPPRCTPQLPAAMSCGRWSRAAAGRTSPLTAWRTSAQRRC